MTPHDPHAKPPDNLRKIYKNYQKASLETISNDRAVIDLQRDLSSTRLRQIGLVSAVGLLESLSIPSEDSPSCESLPVYMPSELPGLQVIPNLLNHNAQRALLDRLLHRDLSDNNHQTNVSLHYRIPHEDGLGDGEELSGDSHASQMAARSFFIRPLDSAANFQPLDPSVHKPISNFQFLNKKLRWMTLGGQYDWTDKVYPDGEHPSFPRDIYHMCRAVFPEMKPEAAICNLYHPGDTLSLHRDVSESVNRGLVSLSVGCDAIFMIAEQPDQPVVLRLHSGDAVYMSDSARYAWHGVPQVLGGTCPESVADWPARPLSTLEVAKSRDTDCYDHWRGWLRSKRINLNVRQMFE